MKSKTMILCVLCLLLLLGCKAGDAVSAEPTAAPVEVVEAPTAAPTAQQPTEIIIDIPTQAREEAPAATALSTPEPTAEPTAEPTPEPTATPVPKLGILDGRFADKFVEGEPVLTENSYQSETVAIFINRVVDESKSITNHTFVYYMADVYFKDMEALRSGAAKSWKQRWDNDMLVDVAKKYDAVFAVSGDFTLTRKKGLVTRNGEVLQSNHDTARDVGVIYKDGRMETFTAQNTPAEQIMSDPEVWQILGFGPELLDENGQPKTAFNDPNKVGRANIRNAVGYFEPGHFCFVYVQPYKTRRDDTCLDMASLSQLMYSLGCVRAYNLDGGGTAGMYFNGKLVSDKGLGPTRKLHDIYYIPKV